VLGLQPIEGGLGELWCVCHPTEASGAPWLRPSALGAKASGPVG